MVNLTLGIPPPALRPLSWFCPARDFFPATYYVSAVKDTLLLQQLDQGGQSD